MAGFIRYPALCRWAKVAGTVFVALIVISFAGARAKADAYYEPTGAHPLAPPDTSSPRATMRSFIEALNRTYSLDIADADIESIDIELARAARCLDLSEVAPEFRREVGNETALLLKEILDRISLPPYDQIPGADDLTVTDGDDNGVLEKWTVPSSEITIARMTSGPRKGEYLFNAQTVAEARNFFKRIADQDYQDRDDITPNMYNDYLFTPGPWLERKWVRVLPPFLRASALDQAVWQWAGLVVIFLSGCAVSTFAFRTGRRWDRRRGIGGLPVRSGQILGIVFTLLIIYGSLWVIEFQIRITGAVLQIVAAVMEIVAVALIAWAVAVVSRSIGDSIIVSRHLRPKGIDSQIVRLVFRLLTIVIVIGLVLYLADRLGFPAYSVITGLGIGGLAVALAARETLANFFGSIMIMLDRPFRVGDWIKVGDDEGTVEDIGFRSTRIRTFYNSLLAIPNAETVNKTVDNMGLREFRRVRTVLQLTYDTPVDRVEGFVEGIKEIIRTHPDTRKDYFHVVFNEFGAHSLEILVYFFLKVADWGAELKERETVFLDIIRLAEHLDVKFAFPTQTLHVESLPDDLGRAGRQVATGLGGKDVRPMRG